MDLVIGLDSGNTEKDPMYRHAGIDHYLHPASEGNGLGTDAVRASTRRSSTASPKTVFLVPITAIRRHDGVVEVRNGQRRTVAACKVGLTTVPVYVLAATAADTAAETIDRIVHQKVA